MTTRRFAVTFMHRGRLKTFHSVAANSYEHAAEQARHSYQWTYGTWPTEDPVSITEEHYE